MTFDPLPMLAYAAHSEHSSPQAPFSYSDATDATPSGCQSLETGEAIGEAIQTMRPMFPPLDDDLQATGK